MGPQLEAAQWALGEGVRGNREAVQQGRGDGWARSSFTHMNFTPPSPLKNNTSASTDTSQMTYTHHPMVNWGPSCTLCPEMCPTPWGTGH